MSLNDIVKKVKSDCDIDIDVRPFYLDNLPYTVQYNESNFAFLNRLAKRNGHWFYYNGRTAIFGSPGGVGATPKLMYGINMQDFDYTLKLLPALFKVIENDNNDGQYKTDETLKYRKEADGFHQNFLNRSNEVFNKETIIQLNQTPVGGSGRRSSEEYAKNKMRSILSGLVEIKASSEVPGITIGNEVRVTGVDMQLESSYRVTQITHICDDGGGYENHFTAVNFNGSVFSPETDPDLVPFCKSQTAIVTANADPDGLSGIQVQMPWQAAKGETTPYIPLMQNYGGDARGAHIIPEIGDTVFVDFQGNNAELPIVLGTMTSRKEKSGYSTPNNDIKAIMHSRSGNRIINDDATGDITIESQKGETIAVIHGDGNIRFKAPKNIEFEAGEDIVMKAGRNVNVDAKENIDIEAGNNINQDAGNNIGIRAQGDINEFGDNKTENITENYKRSSHESTQFADEVKIFSTQENMLLESSQKTVEINSAEKSNLF
ncbi:phage baseplate assembly protein V [Flavobacterium sp. MMS24-S5]|uniref:phage baseplate assembly protein V n=1 Tax=Flavobacterium sp. MMS24-S5 TaxID=3416605 RepID=UPI003D0363D6